MTLKYIIQPLMVDAFHKSSRLTQATESIFVLKGGREPSTIVSGSCLRTLRYIILSVVRPDRHSSMSKSDILTL